MFKFANRLSDDNEYAIVVWGQSNSRPWGSKAEGFSEAPHLALDSNGVALTISANYGATVTITIASPGVVTWTGHGLANGATVVLGTTGALPGGIATGTTYYVVNKTNDTFELAATSGGTAINTSGSQSGTHTAIQSSTTLTVSSPTLDASRWINAQVRMGTNAAPKAGYGTVTANATGTVTLTWSFAPTDLTGTAAYLTFTDDRWKYYPNVRVLHPYQPDQGGAYPATYTASAVPGYSVPSSITSYANLGLFLNFSFLEGVVGAGSAASATVASGNVTSGTIASVTTDLYAGGTLLLKKSTGETYYATVTRHTVGTTPLFTMGTWTPSTPADGSTYTYEAWVPHYSNHPYAELRGFRYPSNDMQPGGYVATSTGALLNRPLGTTTTGYGDRFGFMLPAAWRIAHYLGKRIHVIYLGVNAAGQVVQTEENEYGFQGTLGWWDPHTTFTWTPAVSTGLFPRLARMVDTMAPAALTAEGNTKPLKVLGILGYQGETDALSATGREMFTHALPSFYRELTKVIEDADMSAYADGVPIPVVHAHILSFYELAGTYSYYGVSVVLAGDEDGLVNTAIDDFTAKYGLAATFDVEDHDVLSTDLGHHDGVGEALNGESFADLLVPLINRGLAQSNPDFAITVCNLALARLGDSASITSLDSTVDSSQQAALCNRFYQQAVDSLVEMHAWAFATKRVALAEVTNNHEDTYGFAYGLPADMARPIAVLPAETPDDYTIVVENSNTTYSTGSVCREYQIEQDSDGFMVLLTDEEDAHLRYVAKITASLEVPKLFVQALATHLASMLAGPLLKGDVGTAEAAKLRQEAQYWTEKAMVQDARYTEQNPKPDAPWVSGR